MPHTLTKLLLHIVFSTKHRRNFLRGEVSAKTNAYLAGIAAKHGMCVLRAGGTGDHRHLLVQIKPTTSVSDAVRALKANSSRWIKDTFPGLRSFAWQSGYAAFSVSLSAGEKVIQYIDNQQQHHAGTSFEQELVVLLRRHGIEYDPKYLFD